MNTKFVLLLLAAFATGWAVVAWLAGMDSDFKAAAVVAILSLGGVFYLDYRASERARMARYRRQVWDRREAQRIYQLLKGEH